MTVQVSKYLLVPWLYIFTADISQAQESKVNSTIGRTVLLPCYSYIDDQYTNFTWKKNNSVLIMGTTDKFESDIPVKIDRNRIRLPHNSSSGNLSLIISDLKLEDMGMYRCETNSKNQTVKYKEIFLTITKDPVSKPIVQVLPGQNVSEGSIILLKCEAGNSFLPIAYSWYKKTKKTGKPKDIMRYKQTLTLSPAKREDSGFYFCKISKNSKTKRSGMVEILISDSFMETGSNSSNDVSPCGVPQVVNYVISFTSGVILFIVCTILILRSVKKRRKEYEQQSSVQHQQEQRNVAVQTNEKDLGFGPLTRKESKESVTYATIDHTKRLNRPPVNSTKRSLLLDERSLITDKLNSKFNMEIVPVCEAH